MIEFHRVIFRLTIINLECGVLKLKTYTFVSSLLEE